VDILENTMSEHGATTGAATQMREPMVFISHKHTDRVIANAVRSFIESRSNREVRVYQSSSGEAESPDIGRVLTAELKEALWKTGIVILLYTSEDQDWQWCMWECGVATNPNSPDTRIIVFQCSVETPRVFQDQVRVNVRDKEDVLKVVRSFLTDPHFFPGFGRALAPRLPPTGDEVREAADDLHKSLSSVVPTVEVAEWAAQPLLRLQMPLETSEKISAEPRAGSGPSIEVADVTAVSSLDQQAKRIFGIAELPPGIKLRGLAARWLESLPGQTLEWVRDIESQLRRAARGEMPTISWGYLREVGGAARYAPLLTRVRRLPALRALQFDVNLLPYDDLAAIRVTSRMLPLADVVCHRTDQVPLSELKVKDLAVRLKRDRLTRMPFIDSEKRIQLIIHRSMVDHYLSSSITETDGTLDISTVTVAQMLADAPELKSLFQNSFGVVPASARLTDVNAIMSKDRNIQDVFVTATGARDEPILGWITNVMVAQHSA
jgi:hypothetical protein